MIIRRAEERDIDRINDLLVQVAAVHSNGRPDIFKSGCKKYTDDELKAILKDDSTPVFVAEDNENVCGYAFCIYEITSGSNLLCDMKTLYIDDLCVDEELRGKHVGTLLYEYVLNQAKINDAYRVTLNVWSFNDNAMHFYEKRGLSPLKTVMEKIL